MDERTNKLVQILIIVILCGTGLAIPIWIIAYIIWKKQQKKAEEEYNNYVEKARADFEASREKSRIEFEEKCNLFTNGLNYRI